MLTSPCGISYKSLKTICHKVSAFHQAIFDSQWLSIKYANSMNAAWWWYEYLGVLSIQSLALMQIWLPLSLIVQKRATYGKPLYTIWDSSHYKRTSWWQTPIPLRPELPLHLLCFHCINIVCAKYCVPNLKALYNCCVKINTLTQFGYIVGQDNLIVIKLELYVWPCLLDVYTKFQTDISPHVQKIQKIFRLLRALLTPASECFDHQRNTNCPNHDRNQ